MFSTILRTNRQSSNNAFYFLQILFLLHICTAFLTIVNAMNHNNNNDNEAIIQLSMDSIHVVKSSDPRFANIEENANDDDEKELLLALLTSFDDDYKNPKQIHLSKSSEIRSNDEISQTSNCTQSTATASSSSIRFVPSQLEFGEQSIAIARMQTVVIINEDSEPLELQSLSGTTVQFYSSFFTQKTLSANGGNTTINVYYLPRTVGSIKSTITIKTNRGTLNYHVNGIGIQNSFYVRPLIGATVPLNSTYEYLVHFYNPYNYSIDINEIYTSDENLIIELFSIKNQKNKITKNFDHHDKWHLEPYRMRPIVKLNYFAHKLDRLHGFYCIKTNSNDTIIVPVEINVSNRENLYSNVDFIEFSWHGFVHSSATMITIPVYVVNNGLHPVTITDVRVTAANTNYITVHHEQVQVPPGIHHLTKIAELRLNPPSIPKDIKRIRGSVQVYTLSSMNNAEPTLQIPFRANVIHGSIGYDKETTYIYIPSSSTGSGNEKKKDECRSIKFFNQFDRPLIIYNATTDKPELLAQYIKLDVTSPFIYVKQGQSVSPLCINVLKQSLSSAPLANLEATLTLHTNLSFFHLPIYLYSGLLTIDLATDSPNGGIKRNDTNSLEYFIVSIPVNQSRTVEFVLINANPIDISIEQISFTVPKARLQLIKMQRLNGTETNATFKKTIRKDNIVKLVIPARHRAIFSLTIDGVNDLSFYDETITFKTQYETLNMNVKYRIVGGSIDLENKQALHMEVFPNRVGTVDITLQNNFDEPTDVMRIEFPAYGQCFSFRWNSTSPGKLIVQANQTYRIGKLMFDMIPLCNSIQIPSESTCYCGLNNHPEFKRRWEQHVTALDNYELDHTLVTKFRNLWKEWTSLVRKQRLHTDIWLITDQANVTWPVSIGFVWPSVLEHMSSASSRVPVTLDFHLTLTDSAKTQNVIITNPSSSILQYAVELTSTVDTKESKKQGKTGNQHKVFDIATTAKRVDVSNDIYRFNLQPNEHITFTASYRPKQAAKHEMYLVVRNNLTILESILLRGEGGSGSLTVGNRKAGSSDIPLVLEMNEKEYKLCANYPSNDGTRGNPVLQKIVTLRNSGNMKAVIHDISFGQSKCFGQGFSVDVCSEIEIEPNDRYDLHIRFQPDYTLSEVAETLTLHTNIGQITFPIIVRIPQRVLAACYQIIPRPVWESRVYWLCLCAVFIILLFILAVAVFEAQRLFNDYLARAELRSRIPIMNPTLVNLTDLTTAVQDEQKTRERIESRTSVSSMNNRRESSKDENKTKDNELKAKRSNTSVNGKKDHGETVPKPVGAADTPNTSARSVITSPKAVPNKSRRATTDNGQPKSTKQQNETATKSQTLRAPKLTASEQSSAVTSRSPTPPSTVPSTAAVTDEETEPFVVARPKRAPAKVKESVTTATATNNTISIKAAPVTDNAVVTQPTPSPPPPPPPPPAPTVIPKTSIRSDLLEQRQTQQDLSRSSDSINDQHWHMVSSNRGLRKGPTTASHRREPVEESQPTNKTSKTTPTNNNNTASFIENPVVSSSSSHAHASVSNQTTQSRRRRGRRPTRPTSPPNVPILTKRQDSQTKTPSHVHNRELAFRQLAEQLWAAGLPSSKTACSMSVRSRCSSAPPSERGGGDDELSKIGWNNTYDDADEENMIDWDEPGKPDEDFDRYAVQPEQCMNETNEGSDWTPPAPPAPPSTTIQDIPLLISLAATPSPPPSIIPTNVPQKVIPTTTTMIKDDIEPLPFPQRGLGPIQRPNKLSCPPTQSTIPHYLKNPIQSPGTPDVIDQLNHILDHQNSVPTGTTSTPLATPNIPWTPFLPTECGPKYDSTWPLTNMQTPPVLLTAQTQNPFALISAMNEQGQQSPREETTVWSTALGTATPRLVSSAVRSQRPGTWNDFFQSKMPTSTEPTKPPNGSMLKYWSAPDPASVDGVSANGHMTENTNPFWDLSTLSNEPVVAPSINHAQQATSTSWWPNATSDENNNKSSSNRLDDDPNNNRDHSRWDFAR